MTYINNHACSHKQTDKPNHLQLIKYSNSPKTLIRCSGAAFSHSIMGIVLMLEAKYMLVCLRWERTGCFQGNFLLLQVKQCQWVFLRVSRYTEGYKQELQQDPGVNTVWHGFHEMHTQFIDSPRSLCPLLGWWEGEDILNIELTNPT